METVLNDIVEEINIKPNKSKVIIKWIISIAGSLILLAFAFGQYKSSFHSRIDKLENTIEENTSVMLSMKSEMKEGFIVVNQRIDKVYIDGIMTLNNYQDFNKKQLIMILDYGQSNKRLLKQMLELNIQEHHQAMENELIKAKNVVYVKEKENHDYLSIVQIVSETDTIFYVNSATQKYVNEIDKNKFIVNEIKPNRVNKDLFDIKLKKK
jgi:hypothetical protein